MTLARGSRPASAASGSRQPTKASWRLYKVLRVRTRRPSSVLPGWPAPRSREKCLFSASSRGTAHSLAESVTCCIAPFPRPLAWVCRAWLFSSCRARSFCRWRVLRETANPEVLVHAAQTSIAVQPGETALVVSPRLRKGEHILRSLPVLPEPANEDRENEAHVGHQSLPGERVGSATGPGSHARSTTPVLPSQGGTIVSALTGAVRLQCRRSERLARRRSRSYRAPGCLFDLSSYVVMRSRPGGRHSTSPNTLVPTLLDGLVTSLQGNADQVLCPARAVKEGVDRC